MKDKPIKPIALQKWPRREVILFLERLECYISSGLSLDRSIQIMEEDCGKRQKIPIRSMRLSVESGRSFADSLAGTIRLPVTSLGIIRHGESSGRLSQSLAVARALLEHDEELRKKLGSALTYPAVIGIFALLITFGLVRGVMPQIIPMLESLHVELPILTRVVIAFSRGLMSYGLYASIAMAIAFGISVASYRKRAGVKAAAQGTLMRLPLVGKLCARYCISVFLHSCGSLIETGSPAGTSYAKSASSISLLPLRKIFESKNSGLSRGEPVHMAFKGRHVPSFIASLLSAGEMSGTLGASMVRAATILDRDIDHALKRITALVEPVMMAGMGLAVGAIALSILMPIYDISKAIQR